MSYTRWSALLPGPTAAQHDQYNSLGKTVDAAGFDTRMNERARLQAEWRERNGFVRSEYYIYWSDDSGTTRDDQVLAVHCSRGGGAVLSPADAHRAVTTGDWSRIPGYADADEIQRAHARRCVQTWLEEVEEEFGRPSSSSREAGAADVSPGRLP